MSHIEEVSFDEAPDDQPLKEAEGAASRGDPKGMVEALYRSGYLVGLERAMCRKWESLSPDSVGEVVADAVSDLYFAVSDGRQVWNIKSWLWKVCDTMLLHLWSERQQILDSEVDSIQSISPSVEASDSEGVPDAGKFDPYELDPQERRAIALGVARSLMSKLGQRNVQLTMKYIFDALAEGREDVPAEEICAALGHNNVATVRQWISRGFSRLAARASQEGIVDDNFDPAQWANIWDGGAGRSD